MSAQITDMKIIIVVRWAGTPDKDWYPWLTEEIMKKYPNISVDVLNMPHPESAAIHEWVPTVETALKKATSDGFKKIYLVGHSVGKELISSSDT